MLERDETGSRFGPRRPLVMGIGCEPQIRGGTIVTAFPVTRGECSMNAIIRTAATVVALLALAGRSEEHTSELQSLMRISYAVFCLKKKNKKTETSKYKHQQ